MNTGLTIEDFNALMNSTNESQDLEVLRQLTTLDNPGEVQALKAVTPQVSWGGWAW